jgi:hypothetical protein
MRSVKIRIQGDETTVKLVKSYLLDCHEGLVLSTPRKGTNPKYDDNQQYSSYGDIKFSILGEKRQSEKTRKRRKK